MIIGLAGPAEVGKTTVAKFLERKYGYEILSYAAPMKEALVTLTGLPMKAFTDKDEKKIPRPVFDLKTTRQVMQLFGTEFGRNMISQDFWLNLMDQKLDATADIVIDDVRFQDEAWLVQSYGGVVINLSREGVNFDPTHSSERGVNADLEIELPTSIVSAQLHLKQELKGFGII